MRYIMCQVYYTASTRQHGVLIHHTYHTYHTDQAYICPDRSRSCTVGIDHTDHTDHTHHTDHLAEV